VYLLLNKFHQDDLRKSYFQHILQFCIYDYVETNVNLLTDKGLIDISYFKWLNLTISNTPQFNFLEFTNEHNKKREVLDFDLSRFCELEIMKNKWCDISLMENNTKKVEGLKMLFEPGFVVTKILYDDVGFYLFKVFLIASKICNII